MRKRDKATDDSGFTAAPVSTGRITPTEVQQKEFRVARFGGGYRMREVDEFLDQVTDALSALIAENEELRAGRGAASTSSGSLPGPIANDRDRTAVDAFLERERGFLQSLGSLVQGHAEELKAMVRAARRSPAVPAPTAAVDEAAPAAVLAPDVDEVADGEEEEPATEEAPEVAAEEAPDVAADSDPSETADDDGTETAEDSSQAHPAREPDEPIRLEEREPARSRGSDDEPEGSLRELFWGEE
jgi:DivIVA domain-containing protein